MKLILVRHGRPDEGDVARPNDPPLNTDGRRQANAVAALLAQEGVTRIVASPLARARQTAEPLAERLGMPIDIVEGWAEADRCVSRYRSMETLRAHGDDEWRRFLQDPIRFLGGDPESFRAEVLDALGALIAESARSARVAVFTHGMPINIVLSHALGLEGLVHFPPGYGSVTRLRARSDGTIGVVSVNESGHNAWKEPQS
ncbi:MAG: histidine phosphatase family protein [Roseiarcus sp.]|jgi:probable phosphoglycerate mutase